MNRSALVCALQARPQGLAWLGVILAVLCWGGNALVARALHEQISPLALAFWRWALALALLAPFVWRSAWVHREALRRAGWRLAVLAVPSITCFNTLLYAAARTTEAVNITLVNTCLPLVAFVASGVLLREWPGRRAWAGLLLAATGLVYLLAQGSLARLLALEFRLGDLTMLLAISLWALYTVLLRRWRAYLELPPMLLLAALIVLGLPPLLPFYLHELLDGARFVPDLANLAAIGYTAVFASLLAYLCWNHGVRVLGAARASMASYLMPVFTALFGWLLLGEHLAAYHWIGGGVILAGLLLASSRP